MSCTRLFFARSNLVTKLANFLHGLRHATAPPTVAAALALECLKTVTLGRDEAIQLIDAIEPYLEWQSDAAYKKDPPKDYFYPGFDIFDNLAKVKSNLQSGKYAGEYDFQIDLYKQVWAPANDGHFVVFLDLLSRVFNWKRQPLPIVSISEDGTSLPVIKLQGEFRFCPKTHKILGIMHHAPCIMHLTSPNTQRC